MSASLSPIGKRVRMPRKASLYSRSRFTGNRRAALLEHLGYEPSVPQRLLVERVIAQEWALRMLDRKLRTDLSVNDLRGVLKSAAGLESQYRQNLKALGLEPSEPHQSTVAELVASMHEGRPRGVSLPVIILGNLPFPTWELNSTRAYRALGRVYHCVGASGNGVRVSLQDSFWYANNSSVILFVLRFPVRRAMPATMACSEGTEREPGAAVCA